MDLQAQIFECITRLSSLEARVRTAEVFDISRVLADLADLRTEMRQDHAALNDEIIALRRHMNEHFQPFTPNCTESASSNGEVTN